MIELYPFQKTIVEKTIDLFRQLKVRGHTNGMFPRVMIQSATGSGKTEMLFALTQFFLERDPSRNMHWLTHRVELEEQWNARIRNALPFHFIRRCTVTSPIKALNRIEKYGKNYLGWKRGDLLVVDEAHHARATTWDNAVKQFPGYVAGATATPWRLSNYLGFDDIFDDMVLGPSLRQLIHDGYLVPITHRAPENGASDAVIHGAGNSSGDFNMAETERSLTPRVNMQAVDWALDRGPNRKILVYCMTVSHAETVAQAFCDRGRKARAVHSKTPKAERKVIAKAFENSEIDVLCNVGIYTEGNNIEDVDCVLLMRPTKSKALYLQSVGRGTRTAPGKTDLLLLDAAENHLRFGTPTAADGGWSLFPRKIKDKDGEAPTKRCKACGTHSPASSRVCTARIDYWDEQCYQADAEDSPCTTHCGRPGGVLCEIGKICGATFGEDCDNCGRYEEGLAKGCLCKICTQSNKDAFTKDQLVSEIYWYLSANGKLCMRYGDYYGGVTERQKKWGMWLKREGDDNFIDTSRTRTYYRFKSEKTARKALEKALFEQFDKK